MTPNMVSKFTDLLKPFCLYLSRFEVQIKKPAFNQTFPSPHLTGKGRARLNAGEMFGALRTGEMYFKRSNSIKYSYLKYKNQVFVEKE